MACVACFFALYAIGYYSVFITNGWILARTGLERERNADGGLVVVVRAFSRSTTGIERPIRKLTDLLNRSSSKAELDVVEVLAASTTVLKPFKRRVSHFIPMAGEHECFAGGLNLSAEGNESIHVVAQSGVQIRERWLYSALANGGGYVVCPKASSLPPQPLGDAAVIRLHRQINLNDLETEVRLRLASSGYPEGRLARIELTWNPRLWEADKNPASVSALSIIGPLALTGFFVLACLQFTGSWFGYEVRKRVGLLQSFGYQKAEQFRHCLGALIFWDYILLFFVTCFVAFSAMVQRVTIDLEPFTYFLAWVGACSLGTLLTTTIRLSLCIK